MSEVHDPNSYVLPALYGLDSHQVERIWKVWSSDETVYKLYGVRGGQMNPVSKRSFQVTNEGKKNEVAAEEQARREAERDWVRQLGKGYRPKSKEGKVLATKILREIEVRGGVRTGVETLIRADAPDKGTKNGSKSQAVKDNGVLPGFQAELKPMHCQVWDWTPKVLKYFTLDQEGGWEYLNPKLDGIRALARRVEIDGESHIVLTSRNSKQIVWLNSLREELLKFLQGTIKVGGRKIEVGSLILDGELYAEKIYGSYTKKGKQYVYQEGEDELPETCRFQIISGVGRPVRGTPHVLEDQICYHVFDIADQSGLTQETRMEILDHLFSRKGCQTPRVCRVPTHVITTQDEVETYQVRYVKKGYEGVVVRAKDLVYESKKSLKMRKYKPDQDEEYLIVGTAHKKGTSKEQFCWRCRIEVKGEEKTFKVKPMGTREQKLDWYQHREDYIGSLLTVRYQETSNDGIPRFPRGIIRES